MEELPHKFFTPDYDPIQELLLEINNEAKWGDDSEDAELEGSPSERLAEVFMTKIEEADTNQDICLGQLADMIEANHSNLMACMRDIHGIDSDLKRATNQISLWSSTDFSRSGNRPKRPPCNSRNITSPGPSS